jgi:F-type H+-transporting ATPase subunit a
VPEHSSWLTLILAYMKDTLSHNASGIGDSFIAKRPATWESFEPIIASFLVMILIVGISASVRSKLEDTDASVVPDDKLTLRTFMEVFLGYFYDIARGVMDSERAKKYFPLIATSAVFVFFANVMALIPGMPVATSSLNVTLGCALVIFIAFNIYGIATQGIGNYLKHFMGPVIWLAPLLFVIELISLCVRPITLALRLVLNMAVDHLIVGIFLGLVAVFLPLPVMGLGIVVVLVQTLVFSLLTAIYIGLATEHEEHH